MDRDDLTQDAPSTYVRDSFERFYTSRPEDGERPAAAFAWWAVYAVIWITVLALVLAWR